MFIYLFKISELRSCVNVEVAVLGSQPSTVRTVSVDVKQRSTRTLFKIPRDIKHVVCILKSR